MKKIILVIFATMIVASVFGQNPFEKTKDEKKAINFAINVIKKDLFFPESFNVTFTEVSKEYTCDLSTVYLFGHHKISGREYIEPIPINETTTISLLYNYEPKGYSIIKDSIVIKELKAEKFGCIYKVLVSGVTKSVDGKKVEIIRMIDVYDYCGKFSIEEPNYNITYTTIKRF